MRQGWYQTGVPISIHALRKESDLAITMIRHPNMHFNPRSP